MTSNIPTDLITIQLQIREGKLNCKDLVRSYLDNINSQKDLNVFVEVFAEEALQRAEEIDAKIKEGKAGSLAGAVISVKDVIAIKDKGLTCSSAILKGFTSLYDSTAVARLKAEDAIIIGRVNCDEFAMGSSNENSIYGAVRNPFDKSRVPGGSSGASAVSVAANMCLDLTRFRNRRLNTTAGFILRSHRIESNLRQNIKIRSCCFRIII